MPTSPNNAASAAQSTGIGGGDAPSTQPKEAASDRRDAAPQARRSAAGAEREERIREAAYQRYRQRGDRAGEAMDDWLAAEAEIDEADSAQAQGSSERRP
jgi:hypothetical protein